MTTSEFKAWINGVVSVIGTEQSPSPVVWKKVLEEIEKLELERPFTNNSILTR